MFIILIDDLHASCLTYKFVDDTTLCEFIQRNEPSRMADYITELLNWSDCNHMNVNWKKTKQMIVGPLGLQAVPEFSFNGNIIERVRVFKLLGLCIDQNLKWNSHTNATYAKASSRLFLLKQLKRSGVVTNDLLHFYMSVIRPILEYACPVWHNSLTFEQNKRLEFIQKRAL